MIIATWNVNSIRSRLQHLMQYLREDKPDILLLQELKCTEDQFPFMEIEELGYNIAMVGEKTYNGVAILSKFPINDITRGIPNYTDEHARYIEAVINVPAPKMEGHEPSAREAARHVSDVSCDSGRTYDIFRVVSVYVVNGQTADSDKFAYKLQFLDALISHLKTLRSYDEKIIIGGDYNIAPTDADVAIPSAWVGSVLTHDEVRKRWRTMTNLGMYDAALLANDHTFSWWDYRAGAFEKEDGLRIDHLLLSPQAADSMSGYRVEKKLRGMEKPSDHAPVVVTLNDTAQG